MEDEHDYAAAVDTEEGETADALYDFDADGDDELSVKEGEHLVVLEKDGDEWWKCRNSAGHEGVVPASYLEASLSQTVAIVLPKCLFADDIVGFPCSLCTCR